MQIFTKIIHIDSSHLDERMHVNNIMYLYWVQDISKSHWESSVNKEIAKKYYWVVRNHFIEYKKEAFEGETLLAKTFVKGYKGPFSERIVEFYREENLIVRARSNWCMINVLTKKPEKIPLEVSSLFE